MNAQRIDRIADALLYEGYMLYPYRPSVKNRQRWTFGGLLPRAYCEAHPCGGDIWRMHTECLIRGDADTTLQVRFRFLHLLTREVFPGSANQELPDDPARQAVDAMCVDDRIMQTWQEASERAFEPAKWTLDALLRETWQDEFRFSESRHSEAIHARDGNEVGQLVRQQDAITGTIKVSAIQTSPGVFKVRAAIENHSPFDNPQMQSREKALLRALVSTHVILHVDGGQFLSLIDPPIDVIELARQCENVGTWPVMVGEPGDTHSMLAAPIILYDYPQIAEESPGDLFDSTEIDEILTLRIQTLTDDEKRQAANLDDRVRVLLERTERLGRDQMRGLHGTMRGMRVLSKEESQ